MLLAGSARLEIRLLGTFSAVLDGVPLAGYRSAKVRALLAYLAVEAGRPHRREGLATLLWGEFPERDAQRSLSQALSNLRTVLAPLTSAQEPSASGGESPFLTISGQAVELKPHPRTLWVDLRAFDALLADADPRRAPAGQEPGSEGRLAQAVALYQGPFLAGLSLPDSPEFEEWRLLHQERCHQAALLALERLVSHHLAEGRTDEVETLARRQLALEPWNEGAHQSLMLALALDGRRAAALRQYELCRRVLAQELGAEPSIETETLALQIRAGRIPAASSEAPAPAGGGSLLPVVPCAASPGPFVARDREMARLDRFLELALAGQGRVAFVAGEAGSGKTTLLGQFARRAMGMHRSLVVACGRCSAFAGVGDPFLPFREMLQTLCGEVEAGSSGDTGNADQMRRLWALFPWAAEALLEVGPDLVGRFVSAEGLQGRAELLAGRSAPWSARLAGRLRSRLLALGEGRGTATILGQEAVFGQVTAVLQALARQRPLMLLLDDLQWADLASLSLLFHLGRRLGRSRILIVGAYRPGEAPAVEPTLPSLGPSAGPAAADQGALPHDAQERPPLESLVHELTRHWGDISVDLDRAGGRLFVDALLDRNPNRLGEAFRQRLTRQTAGHALFTVELLTMFQERGELLQDDEGRWVEAATHPGKGLPPRVEAVIAERVGRLPRAPRRVLNAAAVEGELFSAEVVAIALGMEAAQVRELLSGPLTGTNRLVQPLGLQRLVEGGEALSRYRFAHSLVHEYVVDHLDAVQQAHLHGQVGAALEGLCQGEDGALVQLSPQLAQHYEQAGEAGRAAHFLLLAGRQATRLTAYEQAITHYRRGLSLLAQMPDSPERQRRQIEMHLALDVPLVLARGWGAPERAAALGEVHRMALRLGEPQPLMRVLLLLVDLHNWLGQNGPALERSEELLRLAEQERDPFYRAAAHLAAGLSELHHAHLVASRAHLEQALALGSPGAGSPRPPAPAEKRAVRPPLLPVAEDDTPVAALAWLSCIQAIMGEDHQAQARSRQALAAVEGLADPLAKLMVLVTAGAAFHAVRRDAAGVRAQVERLRDLIEREGLAVSSGWAAFFLGWAQAQQGEPDAGLAAMRAGLANMESGGSLAFRPLLSCFLGETLLLANRAQEGLQALGKTGIHAGRAYEAEAHRLRGELLLVGESTRPPSILEGSTDPSLEGLSAAGSAAAQEAEAWLQSALEVARRQEARLFELRAARSLARLWQRQGRTREARDLLTGVLAALTEPCDTLDVREARALLDELC